MTTKLLNKFSLPEELKIMLERNGNFEIPESREQLVSWAKGDTLNADKYFEVGYDVPGQGWFVEANVATCKNGVSINFTHEYMRRRDPDCMVIGDDLETDKPTYQDRYGNQFDPLRQSTFEWLEKQQLIVMPFMAGGKHGYGYEAIFVGPKNAAFFAGGLADLQGMVPAAEIRDGFAPKAVIYLAPPFRHTHFDSKQVVVHNRLEGMHEVFSYNLYPGPSAKKGIYGVLLNIGETEGWVTVHASTVRVVTPYDNVITIMHEGASGGGKSEMLEPLHTEKAGVVCLGRNTVSDECLYLELADTCELQPVTDDMALCPPALQGQGDKLAVVDAEQGWFLRINHITEYGTDPHYEKLSIHPKEPLIFLNIDGKPDATCLIWEHTMDAPGRPCPNPRVIMPRHLVPRVISEPVDIDIRSFGVRTPPCTKEKPTYGILGFLHVLPPALAWLWRLTAPRGHDNPSITDTLGMTSEGVGSYWPFATGLMVHHANLLLDQVLENTRTRYILTPNQHVGAYKVGFMPQWITREYLARRGSARFTQDKLRPARCTLLGYSVRDVKVDGHYLNKELLRPNRQPEVGDAAYDKGAEILGTFFKKELDKFNTAELNPVGQKIIQCCLEDAPLEAYLELIPMHY